LRFSLRVRARACALRRCAAPGARGTLRVRALARVGARNGRTQRHAAPRAAHRTQRFCTQRLRDLTRPFSRVRSAAAAAAALSPLERFFEGTPAKLRQACRPY
jgi:hypothetical protein